MGRTIKKRLDDYPFAHRQPSHDGHCAFIHGHNWDFEFTFASQELDECGFIYDFGKLKWLKEWLDDHFDHTLVLQEDDPLWSEHSKSLVELKKFADIKKLPSVSCEGIAEYVFHQVNEMLARKEDRKVWLEEVTVYEDKKNSATYFQDKNSESRSR